MASCVCDVAFMSHMCRMHGVHGQVMSLYDMCALLQYTRPYACSPHMAYGSQHQLCSCGMGKRCCRGQVSPAVGVICISICISLLSLTPCTYVARCSAVWRVRCPIICLCLFFTDR